MKNKTIKIAELFLRPAHSFGQTQRFIAESDIPKMVGQICDRSIGANKDKIIENDLCRCGHKRKYHGKTTSINYTQGKCSKCDCQNFVIQSARSSRIASLYSGGVSEIDKEKLKLDLWKNIIANSYSMDGGPDGDTHKIHDDELEEAIDFAISRIGSHPTPEISEGEIEEYLEDNGCANLCLNLHAKGGNHPDERIWATDIIEAYYQAKSKKELNDN